MIPERKRQRLIARIRKAESVISEVRDELFHLDEEECARMLTTALGNTTVVRCDLEDPL